jgi:Tfp pilus assembly protein PilF
MYNRVHLSSSEPEARTMAQQDTFASQLGQAWGQLRNNNRRDAQAGFQQILQSDANHVDALYGLALAQMVDGQHQAARGNFERCLELVKKNITGDRQLLLLRMIQQRMHELGTK